MDQFSILTNRKRAFIALIHSIVFLGVAVHGFFAPKQALAHGPGFTGGLILLSVYVIVASILAWLTKISRCLAERVYFAFCTTSATCGFLRTLFGDSAVPPAQYLRVLMLLCAVGLGYAILRWHSEPVADSTSSAQAEF